MKGPAPDKREGRAAATYAVLTVLAFVAAAALGACGPLWAAMPWAVAP